MSAEFSDTGHGISVVIGKSAALGSPSPLTSLAPDEVSAYSHRINSIGGYESAEITISANSVAEAEEWFQKSLGRHVAVHGRSGKQVWEGFVDTVAVKAAALSIRRGPLMDAANRVSVMYVPILKPEEDPPVVGTLTETTITNDTESQNKYGILERVLSGGQLLDDGTTNDAEAVRDVFLEDNKDPRTSGSVDAPTASSGGLNVSLRCRGYFSWLGKYVYNDGTYNYSITASTKIKNVLGADPNGIFSTDYGLISSNAVLTTGLEDQNRTAETIIKEIIALGDGTDTPYTFGIYDGRVCVYSAIPTEAEYYYYIFSEQQVMSRSTREPIDPYDIKPGRWALVPDFQFGGALSGQGVKEDPRAIFIESVDFTAPDRVSISGTPILRLPYMLARLGYGGIS